MDPVVQSNNAGTPSPWMTAAQAAAYLGLALGTIYNLVSARRIPHARRGRIVRFHRERLDSWLVKGACPGRTTLTVSSRPQSTGGTSL